MAITLIYANRTFDAVSARPRGDDLWLAFDDVQATTGWKHQPQGMCLGDRCVPIPPARSGAFISAQGTFNLAEFARYLREPVVHDDDAEIWLFGEAAATRRDALRSLQAPDFQLPDLDGVDHALSDYRGKKVLLLSWASW